MIFSRKALTTLTVAATLLSVKAAANEAKEYESEHSLQQWLVNQYGIPVTSDQHDGRWSYKELKQAKDLFRKLDQEVIKKAILEMRHYNLWQEYQETRKLCTVDSVVPREDEKYGDADQKKIDAKTAACAKVIAFRKQNSGIKLNLKIK